MEQQNRRTHQRRTHQKGIVGRLALTSVLVLGLNSTSLMAEELTPEVKAKISEYQQKLTKWSQDPELVKAIKEKNSASAPKINNDKWKALNEKDPAVTAFQTNKAGKILTSLESDKSIGKLFLRDKNGNLVAGSKKPAIFNVSDRPAYVNAMRGKTWSSAKIKADPTTNLKSVQVSAPVMSEGKVIGVLHTSVIAE
jgi:hypothetical protein